MLKLVLVYESPLIWSVHAPENGKADSQGEEISDTLPSRPYLAYLSRNEGRYS